MNDAKSEKLLQTEPPQDFDALKAAILDRGDALPKRLRQVAVFALEHPDDVAFGTAAGIADTAQVQPSTLVRFAQTLGYSGFTELQGVFRDRLREGFPGYRDRVAALAAEEVSLGGPMALFQGFAQSAATSLDHARMTLDAAKLNQAVELLAKADTIYLLGSRRVCPVATYFAYAFGNLGLKAFLVDQVGQLGPEQCGSATEKDALLVTSFTPYAPTTLELTRELSARGVPVVAITDSAFSPLAPSATVWLEVAEANFASFRSLAATLALATTLAVGTAEARGRRR